ncbi:MAG: SLC13/DASS family transporter, partial [Alloprevotella tannerae]|nr:SLC13/DASS family transporter [Alloprevotella tannerae]
MAHPIALTIIVLVGIIAALIRDRLRPGLVMTSGAIIFYCSGLLSTKEFLEGFANKGLMTVALLFLISEGVRRSGLLEKFVGHVLPKQQTSIKGTQLRALPFVAFISAFLNNTPIVVIFAPMLKRWAERRHLSATKFLIPLSYATILGGMCTLIGTSTNLVVDGLVTEAGYPGFSMFEIGKVGIFIAFFGLLYLILFSDRLLPEARESIDLAN